MSGSMRDQAAATAVDLFLNDRRTALVLSEISVDRFSSAIHHDPTRAVNVGIMEQTMVGVAAGFALEGFRPILHTIAPFIAERAIEQVKLDLGYQGLAATIVPTGGSYDYSTEGATHHAPGDVQALLSIPGIEVYCPGSPAEVDTLLRAAHGSDGVSYVRLSARGNRLARDVVPGRTETVRRGTGGTVVAIGPMLDTALAATAEFDLTVLYCSTVAPFDATTVRQLAAAGPVIVVEPFYEGSMGGIVAAALDRPARIHEIGVRKEFIRKYGTIEELDAAVGLDPQSVRRRLEAILDV